MRNDTNPRSRIGIALVFSTSLLCPEFATAQPPPQNAGWSYNTGGQLPAPAPHRSSRGSRKRSALEIGTLYGTSVGYGVGVGIWLGAETGIEDPGIFLIPPAILGVAAPVGVYFLDDPSMPRGMPAAIAAGMAIGAGEGIGIASYQFVTADEADAWGFRGLARATTLGATLGGVGGYLLGYYQEPDPRSTVLTSSSVLWGAAIGSMFGYGASEAGVGYGRANDSASLGGLIGYNVGLAAGAGLSALMVPSWEQIGWMWAGAGIGTAASLPVFLFYAEDDGPPAKRGFLFMGTAATLGVVAGGLFSSGAVDDIAVNEEPSTARAWAELEYVGPIPVESGLGIGLQGTLL